MEEPSEGLSVPGEQIRIHLEPAPIWVRLLAGAADSIVAGLLAMAIILTLLIPRFFPETEAILYDYAEQAGGSILTETDLASSMMENPELRNMLFASQAILYSVFFLYFFINEWALRGSSLGKLIFRITTVRRQLDQPLSVGNMVLRAWLKTVFLLLFSPLLWITFTWALLNKEKRTVHDLLTGTWVID